MAKVNLPSATVAPTSHGNSVETGQVFDHPLATPKLRRDEGYFDDKRSLSDFVLIRKDRIASSADVKAVEDSKENVVLPTVSTSKGARMRVSAVGGSGFKGGKQRSLRTWIYYKSTVTSGSAVSSAPTFALQPDLCSEYNSLATLYDDCKVEKARIFIGSYSSTALSVPANAAFAYDPVDNSAYTSVAGILPAQNRFGPYRLGTGGPASPSPVTATGFNTWEFDLPTGNAALSSVGNSSNQVGVYFPTVQSGISAGWVKGFVEAGNAGTNTTVVFIGMLCHFRSRT